MGAIKSWITPFSITDWKESHWIWRCIWKIQVLIMRKRCSGKRSRKHRAKTRWSSKGNWWLENIDRKTLILTKPDWFHKHFSHFFNRSCFQTGDKRKNLLDDMASQLLMRSDEITNLKEELGEKITKLTSDLKVKTILLMDKTKVV